MSEFRWKRLQELFHTAQSLVGGERARFLDAECDDPELRHEVERLLTSHEVTEDVVGNVVRAAVAHDFASPAVLRDARALIARFEEVLASRYLVMEEVGRGGMAIVLKAYDIKHERNVAIKILDTAANPNMSGSSPPDAAARDRFAQEIKLAARLSHPHILPIFDSGEVDGFLYYLAPLAEGDTLAARISRFGALPIAEAIDVTRSLALALGYAHENGVLHRDIKPENILLQGGAPMLADFGIAKAVSTVLEERVTTEVGMIVGTPAYMSPEQLLGGAEIDARSDIYSLACVLFEMLTGSRPFDGSRRSSIGKRLVEDAPRLSLHRSGIPAALDALLVKALARDPDDRFATANELAEALASVRTADGPEVTRHLESLAILPFANRSSSTDDEYLADGLSEELIRILSNIDGLHVVARTSSFSFKGSSEGVQSIGAKLGVGVVLEGSLQRAGSRLRVRVQLVDVSNGRDLWVERYDRDVADVFAVQDEIARAIASVLEVRLRGDNRPLVNNIRAYDYYLRARQQIFRFTESALERAVSYLEQGIEIEGEDSIPLQAALGYALWQYVNAGIRPDVKYLDAAQACADRIQAIDAKSPHGLRLTGLIAIHRGDAALAVSRLSSALEQDPTDTDSLFWLTLLRGFAGEVDLAASLADRLISLDPLTALHQMLPGFVALMKGDFDQACPAFQAACEMEPVNPVLRLGLGQALAMSGRLSEARDVFSRLQSDMPDNFFARLARFIDLALSDDVGRALEVVDEQLVDAARADLQWCWILAQGYALAGAIEDAADWLEQAVHLGLRNRELLAVADPLLANLRTSPSFDRVIAAL